MVFGCLVFIFVFVRSAISTCQSPYVDLCYNGHEFARNQIEGENEVDICNCEQVTFCSLIELSEECNSATVILTTDGNVTLSTQLKCSVRNALVDSLPYQILNKSENEFIVNVFTEFSFGKYKVVCDLTEIPDEFVSPNYTQWEISDVKPTEVSVDSTVELQVTVVRQSNGSSIPTWCFVSTPDKNVQIFPTVWNSESEISCLGFSPATPGLFSISLGSTFTSNVFNKSRNIKVTSKHPVAESAEYSSDFQTIFIYFDGNIELNSKCENIFPRNSLEYLGTDFSCSTRGNTLVVRLGEKFEVINKIEISPDNKIYRAGCQTPEFCLPALSANLNITKPKVSSPNLSLYMDSPCKVGSITKQMSVKLIPSGQVTFAPQNRTTHTVSSGKRQRKNLMMWRTMRQVQSRLSSQQIVLHSNETEVLESLTSLVDDLNVDEKNLGSAASVLVSIQSSPTVVLAEAEVTFCEGLVKLFQYKWTVNGKDVLEDGNLLILRDLPPGKYIIKCVVVAVDSPEVFGQGWTTTEILTAEEKVVISPSETTAGPSDDISLRAVTWHGSSVSWTCRMEPDKLCFTTNNKLVSDVIDLNSQNVSIPGGTLPVGVYFWTIENTKGLNKAKVVIKNEQGPIVKFESSVFVTPDAVLQSTVERIEDDCSTWWSSVRQNGFNYLQLNETETTSEKEYNSTREIPLVIPSKTTKPDCFYLFQLQIFCPNSRTNQKGSYDYLKIPVVVSNPPRISPLNVHPLTGVAMVTNFTISGAEAESPFDDHPLIYDWSYVDSCDNEIPIKRGAFSKNFTTYLPPGDIKVTVRVCNGRKICSTATTPTVNVIQDSDTIVDNFNNARIKIDHLLTSGDIIEGFGLSVTVFKSLALLAETKIREEMYSTVEKGIKYRMEILAKRVQSDRKTLDAGLEFFEMAVGVGKYFRKGSDILNRLMEFRESILEKSSSY